MSAPGFVDYSKKVAWVLSDIYLARIAYCSCGAVFINARSGWAFWFDGVGK